MSKRVCDENVDPKAPKKPCVKKTIRMVEFDADRTWRQFICVMESASPTHLLLDLDSLSREELAKVIILLEDDAEIILDVFGPEESENVRVAQQYPALCGDWCFAPDDDEGHVIQICGTSIIYYSG